MLLFHGTLVKTIHKAEGSGVGRGTWGVHHTFLSTVLQVLNFS